MNSVIDGDFSGQTTNKVSRASLGSPQRRLSRQSVGGATDNTDVPSKPNKKWVAAKCLRVMKYRTGAYCKVDVGSVYGAALALPQLARSSGWMLSYSVLAVRGLFFMAINVVLQGFLLFMISKEERIVDKLGGQMYLCDFGASLANCPDGPNCVGPGGTVYTSTRLFNWDMWATRRFVRDSLKMIFPDQADAVQSQVDPGEYGLESYYLRITCCFLFVLGLWFDLVGSWEMLELIRCVPSQSDSWIEPNEDADVADDPNGKKKRSSMAVNAQAAEEEFDDGADLGFVKLKITGMPVAWKVFNTLCVFCPKVYLWILTVDIGIVFLMETSVINDMIINCVALAFILTIDELMFNVLPTECGELLNALESYPKFKHIQEHTDEEEEAMHQNEMNWSLFTPKLWANMVPRRLLSMLAVTIFFCSKYYYEHCIMLQDGSWISPDFHYPGENTIPLMSFFTGPIPALFPIPRSQGPYAWQMPHLNRTGYRDEYPEGE